MKSELGVIDRVELKDFQVHESFSCDLSPGITTIVGPSDVGKSSFLRALKWIACNEPSGESFIRWGAKCARVVVCVGETEIVRTKGASVNSYQIGDREFVSFGRDVPPEISSKLRLGEVNFQGQYDRPFWLCYSAGEVARQLNQVVDLEIIDKTLAKLNSLLRGVASEEAVVVLRQEAATKLVERWARVPEMEEGLKTLEACDLVLDRKRLAGSKLSEMIDHCADLIRKSKQSRLVAQHGEGVLGVGVRWSYCSVVAETLCDLVQMLEESEQALSRPVPCLGDLELQAEKVDSLQLEVGRLRPLISELEREERVLSCPVPCLGDLELQAEKVDYLHLEIGRLQVLVSELVLEEQTVDSKDRAVCLIEQELSTKIGEVCPLCKQAIQS